MKTARDLASGTAKGQSDLFLIEGIRLVGEAYAKNLDIVAVVASQTFFQEASTVNLGKLDQIKELNVVEDKLFKQLCTTASPCGIIALARKPEHQLQDILLNGGSSPLIIAEQIQDPGNLGTMTRTALAFGAKGLILSKGTVDHFSPKVVRASMGAIFKLPIASDQDIETCLDKLKTAYVEIIALDAKAKRPFWQEVTPLSAAYVFGNEGSGLSASVLNKADKIVSIPISSQTESLNVAVAMGIVLCHTEIMRKSKATKHE